MFLTQKSDKPLEVLCKQQPEIEQKNHLFKLNLGRNKKEKKNVFRKTKTFRKRRQRDTHTDKLAIYETRQKYIIFSKEFHIL